MGLQVSFSGINGKLPKISIKKLFFPLLVLAAVIFVFFNFSELKEIGRLFAQAKWYWLALAFCSQLLNIIMQGQVYNTIFHVFNFPKLKFSTLFKTVISVVFLNFSIPSLGFAGNIYLVKLLKKIKISEGKGMLSVLVEILCYYAAFILTVVLALAYLFFKLKYIGVAQQVALGVFLCVIIVLGVAIYIFLHDKQKAHSRVKWFAQKTRQVEDGIDPDEWVADVLGDFYEHGRKIKYNKRKVILPVVLQVIKFLTDALTIYLIFLAFGTIPPIGLPLVAFALGRLFGLVSFIPGGVGAFEGAMVLVFNSLGMPLELALSVMLV